MNDNPTINTTINKDNTMKRIFILATLAMTACGPTINPLDTYAPVVDRPNANYSADLAECRVLAKAAQAEYEAQQANEMVANMISGALLGAVIGSTYGGGYAGDGAAYGAAAGLANTNTELAQGGPRRIIDGCLENRGHPVLSDLGAG